MTLKVNHFGVSNVDAKQLEQIVEATGRAPQIVQNRCTSKSAWDKVVRDYCAEHSITYQAFGLLTWSRHVMKTTPVVAAARARRWTPAQVILAFALQKKMTVLTGPTTLAHMKDDVFVWKRGIADKPLTDSELTRIELVDIQDDRSEPQIKATFLNHYSHDVHLFWSSDEKLIHQGVIEADSHINLATYAGHEFLAAMNQDGSGELLRWTAHGDKSVDVVHLGNSISDEL